VLVFHVPISGHLGLKVHGHRGSWVSSDRPLEWSGLSGGVPDRPHLCVRLSTMSKIGACAWFLACACPSVGGGDGNFQSLPSIRSLFCHHFPARDFIISSAFHASLMITSLPLPLSSMPSELGSFCPRNLSHSLGRDPYPPAFPKISIVPH
jgi:hypothetical protein